jgi:hypothetical protein
VAPGRPDGRPHRAAREWTRHVTAGGDGLSGVNGIGGRLAAFDAVCRAAVRTLPVQGAWVSQMSSGGFGGLVYASNDIATRLDQLQFELGDGPGVTAYAGGHPVLADDLARPAVMAHWPVFADAAVEAGARALFALPLCIGAIRLGVLALYRRGPGTLDGEQLAAALRLADVTAYALLDLVAADAAPDVVAARGGHDGDPALAPPPDDFYRAVVHQASGVLMVQLDVTIEQALARLRAHAFGAGIPISDVARAVVTRTLRLER